MNQLLKGADILQAHLDTVVNPTWNFAGRLERPQDHEQNAMVGLASEAGEVLDEGKKRWFHTKKKNGRMDEIKSELGDVMYYFLKTLDVYNITLAEVLHYNKEKLQSRHPELHVVKERFPEEFIQ